MQKAGSLPVGQDAELTSLRFVILTLSVHTSRNFSFAAGSVPGGLYDLYPHEKPTLHYGEIRFA